MKSKEIECNSGVKKYSLSEKIAIMTEMGIDYLYNGKTLEEQHRGIKSLISKIINDVELLEMLDKTDDEFWDEAKSGILIYEDWIAIKEEENLRHTRQYCNNEKFTTQNGKEIVIEEGKELPALVYQKKRHVNEDWFYRI